MAAALPFPRGLVMNTVKAIFGGGKVQGPDAGLIAAQKRQLEAVTKREADAQATTDARKRALRARQGAGGAGPTLNIGTGFAGVKEKLGG